MSAQGELTMKLTLHGVFAGVLMVIAFAFASQPATASTLTTLHSQTTFVALVNLSVAASSGNEVEVEDENEVENEVEDENEIEDENEVEDDTTEGEDQSGGDDSEDNASGGHDNSGETEGNVDDISGEDDNDGSLEEGEVEDEGECEGAHEGEGEGEVNGEGEGEGEGQATGEGEGEGEGQPMGEGEGEGEGQAAGTISLDRVVGGNNTYDPGATVLVSATISSTLNEPVAALGLTETLPAGWSLNAVVDAVGAQTVPNAGAEGTINFAWINVPVFPATLQYSLNVPADATGSLDISGEVLYRTASSAELSSGVVVTTVISNVPGAATFMTSDTNKSRTINLSEVLRGVQLYNIGQFHCSDGSEDGYAPGAGAEDCTPHDSDHVVRDFKVELGELLRLVQFYNSKGHAYHHKDGTEDGFAPGVYQP